MPKHNDDLPGFHWSQPVPANVEVYQPKRCYEDHPKLTLLNGTMTGGNCRHVPDEADIYIGLDEGSACPPRFRPGAEQPVSVVYPIVNMKAPNRPEKFKALVDYIIAALDDGYHVHVGCIGGHGRTGMVIAAVVAQIGYEFPIAWVRDNYCKRAVETKAQVNFLVAHYGAEVQTGSYEKKG